METQNANNMQFCTKHLVNKSFLHRLSCKLSQTVSSRENLPDMQLDRDAYIFCQESVFCVTRFSKGGFISSLI